VALLLQVWEMMASQLEQIVFTLMTRALAIGGKLNCPPPLPRVVFKKLFSELGMTAAEQAWLVLKSNFGMETRQQLAALSLPLHLL